MGINFTYNRVDSNIYYRPGTSSKQSEFRILGSDNYKVCVARVYQNYINKTKNKEGIVEDFFVQCIVYVVKQNDSTNQTMHRATKSKLQKSLDKIKNYEMENPNENIGPLTKMYWATTDARTSQHNVNESLPIGKPSNFTMDQLQNLDSISAEMQNKKKKTETR